MHPEPSKSSLGPCTPKWTAGNNLVSVVGDTLGFSPQSLNFYGFIKPSIQLCFTLRKKEKKERKILWGLGPGGGGGANLSEQRQRSNKWHYAPALSLGTNTVRLMGQTKPLPIIQTYLFICILCTFSICPLCGSAQVQTLLQASQFQKNSLSLPFPWIY